MKKITRARSRSASEEISRAELLECRRLLSGELDTTWGVGGVATSNPQAPISDYPVSVALAPNGDTVVVGGPNPGYYGSAAGPLAVTRYGTNGQLDSTFGNHGTVQLSLLATKEVQYYQQAYVGGAQVAVQTDGKIVVAVDWHNNTDGTVSSPFDVFRLNTDGTLDNTFGNKGEAEFNFSAHMNTIKALTITSSGQIVVAGDEEDGSIAIARLNSNGTLDPTFSNRGVFGYYVAQIGNIGAVAIGAGGEVIVAGSGWIPNAGRPSQENLGIVGTENNGATPNLFAYTPDVQQPVPVSMAIGPSGQIDLTESSPTMEVLQFTSTGAVDTSFGNNGVLQLNVGPPGTTVSGVLDSIAWTTGGDMVVAGITSSAAAKIFSARISATGAIELLSPLSPFNGANGAAVVRSDGSVTFAGSVNAGSQGTAELSLARLDVTGNLDSTFGTNGATITQISGAGYSMNVTSSVLQPDGKLLEGGNTELGFAMTRFNADGSLDTSFGNDGIVITNFSGISASGSPDSSPGVMALQPNGDIVVVGYISGNGVVVARYTSDGVLDPTFGPAISAGEKQVGSPQIEADGHSAAVAIAPNGEIVLATGAASATYVTLLEPNGTIDTSFGTSGVFLTSQTSTPQLVTVTSNGDILVAGTTLLRLLPTGQPDTTFGAAGYVNQGAAGLGPIESLAIQPNGMILLGAVVAGVQNLFDQELAVARFTSGGVLDTTFNSMGIENLVGPKYGSGVTSLVVLSNGDILAAAGGASVYAVGGGISLWELQPNGGLDTTFGTNGTINTSVGLDSVGGSANAYVAAGVRPGGNIVVAASAGVYYYYSADSFLGAQFLGNTSTATGTITGIVYSDLNGNGAQDPGEGGFAGATVYLDLNNDGTLDPNDPTAVTTSTGNFAFTGLQPGMYVVRELLNSDYYSTGLGSAQTAAVTPGSVTNLVFSAAEYPTITGTVATTGNGLFGVTVYLDANNNSMLDAGELSTTTNSTGAYRFNQVPNGSYIIRQILPAGYTQSSPANNAGIAVTMMNGTVLSNENFVDAPVVVTGSISGTVTAGAAPISGEFIQLTGINGSTGSAIAETLSDGSYEFSNLQPGEYQITQTLPEYYTQLIPTNNAGFVVELSSGAAVTNENFIDAAPGSVSGSVTAGGSPLAGETVYLDANNDSMLDNGELSTITASDGTFSFSNVPTGSYFLRQILLNGYTQISPGGNAGIGFTLLGGASLTGKNFVDALSTPPQLTGTTIGTAGSYQNDGNTIAKATDGNLTTFFDAPTANGNWVGIGLGPTGGVVTEIKYASRSGWASRMNGGIFQASDSATFAAGVVNLFTIPANSNPSSTVLTAQAIPNTTAYRYYRYLSPAGSFGNISEFQIFGTAGGLVVTGPTQLTGTTIGTAGSYQNDGNTIAKATDGNLSTFFDAPTANGNWVGLDLGTTGGVVTEIKFASRSGYASRMNGGIFQASDSATFDSGVVNLYTIAANANPGSTSLTTVTITNTTAYRYYRYLSPNGSYGNVSEVQFFGTPGGLTTLTQRTGTAIGTAGSYQNDGNTIAKATDGNLSTYFDAPTANGDWVGLDLGSAESISQISYAPRSGFASRMVGGEFQISTTADFSSGVTTIYTVTATPVAGSLTTVTLASPVTARYVRYLSPNGGYGNVAEIAFFG